MNMNSLNIVRCIAFYLPQFHPIQENDEWWGKGFTEWTNVAKAKPLFPTHHQPRLPADLGFYDLRVPEVRSAQAELARKAGIEGFCYYHYWFEGRELLERPISEIMATGQPDFPFCLCWANETWKGKWHGLSNNKVLIEQTYSGIKDDTNHFYKLLPIFQDPRYIKIDGRPFFVIYKPNDLPRKTLDLWRELAEKEGLGGLYLAGVSEMPWDYSASGYDGAIASVITMASRMTESKGLCFVRKIFRRLMRWPEDIYKYCDCMPYFTRPECEEENIFPCLVPNWDNTPRSGRKGFVLTGSTPEYFRSHLKKVLSQVARKKQENRIVILKSWNEWAEGNYVEPDQQYGHSYLNVIEEEIYNFKINKS